jgi:hypothetical protein
MRVLVASSPAMAALMGESWRMLAMREARLPVWHGTATH